MSDSLLVSLHGEQHGSHVHSTVGMERIKKKKLHQSTNTSNSPHRPNALSPELTILFLPWMARSLRPSNNMSVCLEKEKKKRERERKKKQAVELYIFLMEGDTVGALRINLDAWMES